MHGDQPWGDRRTPTALTGTTREYTGQQRDDTGLLFYNARYYDPVLARFVSPDTIVPGTSAGSGGAAATVGSGSTSSLTVDFHEGGFLSLLNAVNAQRMGQGFWFESGDGEGPSGPANPQALNRYSYVLNNPLRYTDPTGHIPRPSIIDAAGCVSVGAVACGMAIGIAAKAERVAEKLLPGDSPLAVQLRNAFLHAYAAALLVKYLGGQKTEIILNAHEGGPQWLVLTDKLRTTNPRAYWDHVQDYNNNAVGMSIGAEYWPWDDDDEVARAVMASLQNGDLSVKDWKHELPQGVISSDVAYSEWQKGGRR